MDGAVISQKLLLEIIEYVEDMEKQIDGEFGDCRSVEQLIKNNEMPYFYMEIKRLLSTINTTCWLE